MALIDEYNNAQNQTLQQRVEMSIISAAIAIANAAPTTDYNADQKRKALAVAVLNNPTFYVMNFTLACTSEGINQAASTDGEIDTTVAAVWNAVAGV